jgi:hypothetical protein
LQIFFSHILYFLLPSFQSKGQTKNKTEWRGKNMSNDVDDGKNHNSTAAAMLLLEIVVYQKQTL